MSRLILLITILCLYQSDTQAQCPSTIAALGNGNGLQICWPNGEAPNTLDSITYDDVTYAGNFVNGGQGDCWRTTNAATTGTNGNHQIEFDFDGSLIICEVVDGVVNPEPTNLSVEYLYFMAKSTEDGAQILWETAEEENNDYFLVERSMDGFNFEPLAEVPGVGIASAYQYHDSEVAFLKGTYYYRLKQVDFDGTSEYSAVQSVRIDPNLSKELNIFPNPVRNLLYVVLENEMEDDLSIQVLNLAGQVVLQKEVAASASQGTTELDVTALELGCYIIEIQSNGFSGKRTFIKQ